MERLPRNGLSLALLAALVLGPPLASAEPNVQEITFEDLDGNELRTIGLSQAVNIVVTLNNTENGTINTTVILEITIESVESGTTRTVNVSREISLPGDGEVQVSYLWSAAGRTKGEYSINVTLQGSSLPGLGRQVSVAETAVEAGSFPERILQYWWIVAGFLAATILSLVVLAVRKT